MRSNFLFAFTLTLILTTAVFPWGKVGHKLINKEAIEILPPEMIAFKEWKSYLIQHAADADDRRDLDKSESKRHYIDIDFYNDFNNDKMIYDKQTLISMYGDSVVISIGTLPWTTVETYNNLVQAFKENDRDKALIYVADLAHYVADGHQPFHTVLNYNGQLTHQKGMHSRYESFMIDKFYDNIFPLLHPNKANYISQPLDFIFNYISNSNSIYNVILDADNYAFQKANSREDYEYYRLLWFKTKYITSIQITKAAEDVASLIYSAWVDAGKPDYKLFN